MTTAQILRELEAAGTEQNRRVYRRHGVSGAVFGASYAVQRALAKKAGRDTKLAEGLWASGNHDARVLATLVADPATIPAGTVDAWARDLDNYIIADAFSVLVSQTPHAAARAAKWENSANEWLGAAAWNIIGTLSAKSDGFDDRTVMALLDTIESDIHDRRNRVRYAMNNALIAIGLRGAAFEQRALAVAKAIGKVDVDHGETGCKTPDAASYIVKASAHNKAKAARKSAKARR
ncbi:MAG: DNA alkylation repair protein [Longimicrobiales bacterium]